MSGLPSVQTTICTYHRIVALRGRKHLSSNDYILIHPDSLRGRSIDLACQLQSEDDGMTYSFQWFAWDRRSYSPDRFCSWSLSWSRRNKPSFTFSTRCFRHSSFRMPFLPDSLGRAWGADQGRMLGFNFATDDQFHPSRRNVLTSWSAPLQKSMERAWEPDDFDFPDRSKYRIEDKSHPLDHQRQHQKQHSPIRINVDWEYRRLLM